MPKDSIPQRLRDLLIEVDRVAIGLAVHTLLEASRGLHALADELDWESEGVAGLEQPA